MLVQERLRDVIKAALSAAFEDHALGLLESTDVPIVIEKPKQASHGDLACGLSLKLSSGAKMTPLQIADVLASYIRRQLQEDNSAITDLSVAAPGFLNFRLGTGWLCDSLLEIHKQGETFGRGKIQNKRVLIEYVSANPTGELHIGHGRNAVYGSTLSNLLKWAGFDVEQEFYVNDTGEQINALGACAWALYQRRLKRDVPYPETGYPEESLVDYVDSIILDIGDSALNLSNERGAKELAALTKAKSRQQQEDVLVHLRIVFDRWYSETALHESGVVSNVLEKFKRLGHAYESDGALWLKSDDASDERPRVLCKSNGSTTYLANDSAYHLDKYRRGYDLMINIWGADHHGQVPGLKAAMRALGQDPDKLEVILTQIVNLNRDGKAIRMSKRRGTVVTLSEVLDEVGVDAVRFYLAESNPQNQISFDLELAKKTSRENPAFYIQYAHARCCAILRRALEPQPDLEQGVQLPILSDERYQTYVEQYKTKREIFENAFSMQSDIFTHQKALVMILQSFPVEINDAAVNRQPGRIARFAFEVANALQRFYEVSRVITEDVNATRAGLGLIIATRQVLANALAVLAISAPERM